jgi:hypothetical protein
MAPVEEIKDRNQIRLQLEEYRQLTLERRFVMTRYMQAIALYLALSYFGLRELTTTPSLPIVAVMTTLFTFLNGLGLYAASHFRNMAIHATVREALLAKKMNFQQPHDLLWGYRSGVLLVGATQVVVFTITGIRFLLPAWSACQHS